MVNIDDFIKRLENILDYHSLNASSFADKIGVQRSSMSHLLSGRNKPSLDFILKIIDIFPDVDLYWLLNGKGIFPKNSEEIEDINTISKFDLPISNKPNQPIDLFSQTSTPNNFQLEEKIKPKSITLENENNEQIEKIVFFYKNGTFRTYNSI